MFRKVSIKILLSVFVILLVMVVLVKIIDTQKGDRTFRNELVKVNAGDITSILLSPKITAGKVITLKKEGDSWKVISPEGEIFNADKNAASNLIAELNRIKPESVVATSKEKWGQFEVTDSLGTNVKLLKGDDVIADIYIGKFSFSQPRKMTSYVRLAGDKEVYGVNGFLSMTFNRDLDSFRDKTVISSSTGDWVKLSFSYPADSSFTLVKIENDWQVNGASADSASVATYLGSIAHLNESAFAKEEPSVAASHILKIEGDNMMPPVEIKGYYLGGGQIVIESNQNPGTYFESGELASKLFPPRSKFME
ncbi:hypothetical protein MNBD_BACTEROID01-1608 [hydrothermal vent metagenome]|uniref:DUF4340 domain-containing protein n=1 Tax=hydrothermal vent metagenome TaxID=652676 RepID=A0A3B0T3R7_9ZZZZ